MAIVVEDGTFPAGANSYVSLQEVDTYFEDRGNAAWEAADDEDKEAAMIRATFDLEALYLGKWIGVKTQSWTEANGDPATPAQVLSWPRVEKAAKAVGDETKLKDVDGIEIGRTTIPTPIKHAQMELAVIELSQRVVGNTINADSVVTSEQVGPIKITYDGNRRPAQPKWPHIDMILAGLVPAGGAFSGVAMKIGLTEAEQNQDDPVDYWNDPRWFLQV